jgi:hypothetical protein
LHTTPSTQSVLQPFVHSVQRNPFPITAQLSGVVENGAAMSTPTH